MIIHVYCIFLKTSKKKNKNDSLQRKTVNSPVISNSFFDESHQNSSLVNDDEIGDVDISDIELGMSLYSKLSRIYQHRG